MELVEQGQTYKFNFSVSGSLNGLSVSMNVLQKPGDTPALTRVLTQVNEEFTGTITSAETAALAVGEWFIHVTATDSDEDIREATKIYVTKGWV